MDIKDYILRASEYEEQGDREAMFNAIRDGLLYVANNENHVGEQGSYELYYMLGIYYLEHNINQAYLCFENALFYCSNDEDRLQIQETIDELIATGNVSVRNTVIIIVSFNGKYYMQKNIEAIRETVATEICSIIVVDNASDNETIEYLEAQEDIILVRNIENVGFSKACNQGVAIADTLVIGENDIFLLNNDTRLGRDSLFWLRMGLYRDDKTGASGSVSNYAGNNQQLDITFELPNDYLNYAKTLNIPEINPYEDRVRLSGFAMLIRGGLWQQVGGMDEDFTPGYFEDDDICMKISRAGYKLALCHNSFIYHAGSQSFAKRDDVCELLIEHQKLFYQKYGFDILKYAYPDKSVIGKIDYSSTDEFNVLILGCGLSAEAKYIKYNYPNANIVGIEENSFLRNIAEKTETVVSDVTTLSTLISVPIFNVLILRKECLDALGDDERSKLASICASGCKVINIIEESEEDELIIPDFSAVKLVVWDMDNTFWKGILSEGSIKAIPENIELIKKLSNAGIINSISSKNNESDVYQALDKLGIKDLFVFNNINWENKGAQLAKKIDDMHLRAENVLFIDDEIRNIEEAKAYCTSIMSYTPAIIPALIEYASNLQTTDLEHNRLKQYRMLEQKQMDMSVSGDNTDFLFNSRIKVTVFNDCLGEIDRIVELISRTNQLNFTKIRDNKETVITYLQDDSIEKGYIHVSDKYGDYGIAGFYCFEKGNLSLRHFLFSCRIMGMGVVEYVYDALGRPDMNIVLPVSLDIQSIKKPKWINCSEYDRQNNHTVKNEDYKKKKHNKIRILLKGPCDMSSIEPYLIGGDITTEFNYVNDSGYITAGQNHIFNITQYANKTLSEISDALTTAPFVSLEDYYTSIFENEYDVICLSLLPDCHAGLYYNKAKDLYINFGSVNFPLTDEENWEGYIDGSIVNHFYPFTREVLESFAEEWEFVGTTSVEALLQNLRYIYENVKGTPDIILVLGSETEYIGDNSEFADHANRHRLVNCAVKQFCDSTERMHYINTTEFISSNDDYIDCINHFSRNVYYDIATNLVSKINDKVKVIQQAREAERIKKNDIAYAVLTHNHPEVMEEVLSSILNEYDNHGIDIYIFDSSKDNSTELIINRFIDAGAANLFYVYCPQIHSGDEKYLYVLTEYEFDNKYKYLWPVKDRSIITGSNLDMIREYAERNYDAILFCAEMNRSTYIYPQVENEYTDIVKLFRDYGALSTSWEALLLNISSMRAGVNWNNYIQKYNLTKDNNFNQPVYLFARLADIISPKVGVVHVNPYERLYSQKAFSEWTNDTFEIFGKKWKHSIEALPDIYNAEKANVIKDETMLPELFGSMDNLLYFYSQGILTNEVFETLKDDWRYLSDIPISYIELILSDNLDDLVKNIISDYHKAYQQQDYVLAAWYHRTNKWLERILGKEQYDYISDYFDCFFDEMNSGIKSTLMNNVYSYQDILKKVK